MVMIASESTIHRPRGKDAILRDRHWGRRVMCETVKEINAVLRRVVTPSRHFRTVQDQHPEQTTARLIT